MFRQRLLAFLLVTLVAASVGIPGLARFGRADPPDPLAIRLLAATFTPLRDESPIIPDALTIQGYTPGTQGYYIVQFRGPVQERWKATLRAKGAEILSYLPDYAFKVRMTPAIAQRVERLNSVIWVGLFHPAYKLSPHLKRDELALYRIILEQGVSFDAIQEALAATGAQILSGSGRSAVVAAEGAQLEQLAHVLDVAWIENFRLPEKHNEYGGGVIMGANIAHTNGYNGSTQTVAVADSGLGDGTAAGAHRDIPASRIVAIRDWPAFDRFNCYDAINDGPQDVDTGHGTHTAGSVLSEGGPNGEGKGTAPAAHLVFQAVEDYADMYGFCSLQLPDGYYLIGIPDDLRDLFQQGYDAGARIHSDSWGSDAQGEYDGNAANTDDFMWNHPDMLVTTSAGNAGIDANSNGFVDEDSMNSPATAKNILAVGASENDRQGHYECDTSLSYTDCSAQGGQNRIFTYGEAHPDNYPADPIASDPIAGNAEQMAAFSSRGPTDDGRIKPDVVAPGTWVLSLYSDLYQQGYDGSPNPQNGAWQYDGWGYPRDQYTKYWGGTSMANPLVTGAAAVVRDFYEKAHSHNASAALVKATLINSAVDILDENNDGVNDNDYPIPNNHEGWGRVHVANATDDSHKWVDEATGLNTGGTATYQFNVGSGGNPFKVSLVWTDYPASTSAATALVNDLDLVVTAPNGTTTYRGNVFSGGWSQTGGSADRTNNVENVYVQSAAAGTWMVRVSGHNVPNGPQPFALVMNGDFDAGPTPTATPTATPGPETPEYFIYLPLVVRDAPVGAYTSNYTGIKR